MLMKSCTLFSIKLAYNCYVTKVIVLQNHGDQHVKKSTDNYHFVASFHSFMYTGAAEATFDRYRAICPQ